MNMKKLLILCSFTFLSLFAVGQNTNVTATVQDPSGQLFKNGNWIASFRRNPSSGSIQPRYAASQVLINEGPFQGSINGSGVLSVTLADSLLVAPAGGQWTFVLCPNVTTGCTTVNVVVTGGSQDISGIVNAQIPVIKLSPGGPLGRAYKDSEIQGGPGNSWLDVTLNVLKYIDTNGVIQTVGNGGGGGGCGAGSCIVNNPADGISQSVNQLVGTDFATNVLNKRMRADLFSWTTLPSVPLSISAGTNIVTLPTCPLGVQGANLNHKLLLGTTGTPEIVTITGGTCTSGAINGTIQFDAVNSHGAGYSIGTATGGLKEASEYAKSTPPNPSVTSQSGYVTVTPGVTLNIQATAYITSSNQTIDFSGSYVECNVLNNLPCIKTGNDISANSALDITLINLRVRAMVPNTGPALEVNSNGTTVRNFTVRQALAGGNYFGSLIQVDNDQAFNLDGFDPSLGTWAKCDSTLCSTAIVAPGPFGTNAAVGWISHANISGQCQFNGVLWKANNTLHINDSVIQSFAQYGIINDTHGGGFGNLVLSNVYEESDACPNPDYVAAGATGAASIVSVGLLTQSPTTITGGEGPSGFVPTLVCTGSAGSVEFNYFVVIKDSIKGTSAPLFAAKTPTNCSGTTTGYFPRVPGTGTVTYDIIRNSSAGAGASIVNPYTSACTGGSANACGSIILAQAQCSPKICTFADNTANNTTSYTVAPPLNKPYLTYWPGNVVISTGGDTAGGVIVLSSLMLDNTDSVTNSNGIGVISTWGNSQPSVYALRCGTIAGLPAVYSCMNGDPSQNNDGWVAMLIGVGPVNGGQAGEANKKGRINFWRSPNSSLQSEELITLVDGTPELTAATSGHWPLGSTLDTWIGIDSGAVNAISSRMAMGSPFSISQYIASLPDGTSYKERLTATLKLFTVPVQVNSGGLTSGILMSDSTTNCGNTNINTSQLCSGTDSGNVFQPVWTQNISGSQVQSALLLKINNDIVGGYASIGSNGLVPISDLVSDPSACAPGTVIAGNQANCINGAGSTSFASLLAGTSTGQAFLVGNGSTFKVTGTGVIEANLMNGVTYPTTSNTGVDKMLITTASNVVGTTAVPNCATAITFSTTTHSFTCASATTLIPMVLLQCNGTNNACPSTAVTGTGSSTALVTYTLPGGTLPANRCLHAKVYFQHTSGTATANFSWTFGATTTTSSANNATTPNLMQADLDVCNYNSTTNNQYIRAGQYVLGSVNLSGSPTSGTEATASNLNISFNFSVAVSDTFSFNGGYITFP